MGRRRVAMATAGPLWSLNERLSSRLGACRWSRSEHPLISEYDVWLELKVQA